MNIERIGAYLSAAELESIAEWCRRFRVPLEDWPEHRECWGWLDLALQRAMADMQKPGPRRRARSDKQALMFACGDFGLSDEATRQRWMRRRRRSLVTK